MERYLDALNEIESLQPFHNQTMKSYMKVLQEIKNEIFNNLRISTTSVCIISQNTIYIYGGGNI